ncbi:hypothetical protein [Ruminiclostridium cellobioparum]|uniref:hypothetical protein n=1 Tax=Ruminiclostridium cellobioparum TaxID=29355 RepID=UPI0004805EDB|nr:hypothetical protein [Ruminiclostridium cellobioparum]
MASIGLRYPAYAPLTENENGTYSYGPGKIAAKAIKVDMKLTVSDEPLYADDGVAERVREFVEGSMIFTPDDLKPEVRAEWLNNTLEEKTVESETVKELSSTTEDTPGYFGFGVYVPKIVGGVRMYRAILFAKIQFGEPDESMETKGQKITWQTPAIEGKMMRRNDGVWKKEVTVSSIATAVAWLKSELNIA